MIDLVGFCGLSVLWAFVCRWSSHKDVIIKWKIVRVATSRMFGSFNWFSLGLWKPCKSHLVWQSGGGVGGGRGSCCGFSPGVFTSPGWHCGPEQGCLIYQFAASTMLRVWFMRRQGRWLNHTGLFFASKCFSPGQCGVAGRAPPGCGGR